MLRGHKKLCVVIRNGALIIHKKLVACFEQRVSRLHILSEPQRGSSLISGDVLGAARRGTPKMGECIDTYSIAVLRRRIAARAAPDAYVSGTGSDANPCSRTLPCLTFTKAVTTVDAGGTVFCLDKVTQIGALVIMKSVEINCRDVHGEIFAPSGDHGVHIATAGVVVSLRGLDILGQQAGAIGVHFTDGNVLS